MSAPNPTICAPWAEITDLVSPCRENAYNFEQDVIDDALLTASEILYHLTYEQWPGPCENVVRPCAAYCTVDTIRTHAYSLSSYGISSWPSNIGMNAETAIGLIGGCMSCGCRDVHQCGCWWVSQIELGQSPIVSVESVLIDGNLVDPDRYRVDDYRWLVYLPDPSGDDSRTGWPCCQRLDLATTEDGTFEVEFTVGGLPSRAGIRAAAVLACQFMLAWTPGNAGECKLPKRVTSLSRQQVSMNLTDPVQLFDKGLTGIAEVDLWVQAIRSERQNRRGAVVIPERQRSQVRRTTFPPA
jgi:hypothetical protein